MMRIPALLTVLFGLVCAAAWAAAPHAGQAAPPFKATTLDGKTLRLSSYKGKAVYLDFFASWCAPCREETPAVVNFSKQYAKAGLVVVGLDDNESSDRATGFRDNFKIPFPVVIADQKLLDSYGVIALPVHVFIDRSGNVKIYRLGEMSPAQIQGAIKQILATPR